MKKSRFSNHGVVSLSATEPIMAALGPELKRPLSVGNIEMLLDELNTDEAGLEAAIKRLPKGKRDALVAGINASIMTSSGSIVSRR